jgi:hypothetical protein
MNLHIHLRRFLSSVLRDQSYFFLLPIVKCERDKLRQEPLSKMESQLNDFEGSVYPTQISKDDKIIRFTVVTALRPKFWLVNLLIVVKDWTCD